MTKAERLESSMRLFAVGAATEINPFSAIPAGLDSYKTGVFLVRASTARWELFRNVSVDPLTERIVVVKMAKPLRAPSGSIAKKLIH